MHYTCDKKELFDWPAGEYSRLYMAIENELAAVICIEDPIKKEAVRYYKKLKKRGIKKAVMMTVTVSVQQKLLLQK